jgi:hypothetical protein
MNFSAVIPLCDSTNSINFVSQVDIDCLEGLLALVISIANVGIEIARDMRTIRELIIRTPYLDWLTPKVAPMIM